MQFHVPLQFVKPLLWSTLSEIMEQSPQGVFLLGSQQANNLVHVLNKSMLPLQLSFSTFYFIIAFSHVFLFLVHYLNHFIFFSLLRTRVNQRFFLKLWQVSIKSIVIFPNSGSDRDIHELSGNLFTYLWSWWIDIGIVLICLQYYLFIYFSSMLLVLEKIDTLWF